MTSLPELTRKQMAALKHVGQVGSELAAQSLSRIVGRSLSEVAASVSLLRFQKVLEVLGGPEAEVVGVYLAIHGEAEGQILLVVPRDRGYSMMHHLYEPGEVQDESSPRVKVGLTLIGDVLGTSLLNALSGTTKLPLYSSPTETVTDMAGAICSQLLASAERHSEQVLLYECRFAWDGGEADAHWLLVPEPESLERILGALGV